MKIKVGSRTSKLALRQTEIVIELLQEKSEIKHTQFEIIGKLTKGDKNLETQLSKIGGKGLFIKELEQALLTGEVDFVVHSMKDMPAQLHDDLIIASIPKRARVEDVFISHKYENINELPSNARIGTSSIRRAQQIKTIYSNIQIENLRGNILSRIEKMKQLNLDGIILAAAGLERLSMIDNNSLDIYVQVLPLSPFLSAIGQGALAIECRKDNLYIRELLAKINDLEVSKAISLERLFLQKMDGNCSIPIAGFSTYDQNTKIYDFRAMYSDGSFPLTYGHIIGTNEEKIVSEMVEKMNNKGKSKC